MRRLKKGLPSAENVIKIEWTYTNQKVKLFAAFEQRLRDKSKHTWKT